MGRLRTLTTLLILGAWGAATDGAPPDDAAAPTSATRPKPPVPPVRYLKAGADLYNNGQYALAAKYLSRPKCTAISSRRTSRRSWTHT